MNVPYDREFLLSCIHRSSHVFMFLERIDEMFEAPPEKIWSAYCDQIGAQSTICFKNRILSHEMKTVDPDEELDYLIWDVVFQFAFEREKEFLKEQWDIAWWRGCYMCNQPEWEIERELEA